MKRNTLLCLAVLTIMFTAFFGTKDTKAWYIPESQATIEDSNIEKTTSNVVQLDDMILNYSYNESKNSVVLLFSRNDKTTHVSLSGEGDISISDEIYKDYYFVNCQLDKDGNYYISIDTNQGKDDNISLTLIFIKGKDKNYFYAPGTKFIIEMCQNTKNDEITTIYDTWKSSTISKKVKKLIKNKKTDEDKVKAIYDYIINNIAVQEVEDYNYDYEVTPEEIMKRGYGDKYGIAELFTCMCRYINLPSAIIVGSHEASYFDVSQKVFYPDSLYNYVFLNDTNTYMFADCYLDGNYIWTNGKKKFVGDYNCNLTTNYVYFATRHVPVGTWGLTDNEYVKFASKIKTSFSKKTVSLSDVSNKDVTLTLNASLVKIVDNEVNYKFKCSCSKSKLISISEDGKTLTLKKGLKKGTYKIKVYVPSTLDYNRVSKTIKITVK